MSPIGIRHLLFATTVLAAAVSGCATTEQEVRAQIEVLAANDIGSQPWEEAVQALSAIGRPGARQLLPLLDPGAYRDLRYREFRDEIERTRTGAATVLGNIHHKAASASMDDRIAPAYRRTERLAALRALGELGYTEAAVGALKAQLADPDPEIRLVAAMAMVKLGDDTARDSVLAAVRGGDAQLASLAISELQHANYRGVPLLVELARHQGRQESHAVRLAATRDSVRAQLLGQLTDDDPEVRRESAAALGGLGDASAAGPLAALLDDPSSLVRFYAAAALVRLGDERGGQFLFSALDHDDPVLRINAIKSLVRVQRQSGSLETRLVQALKADSPRLRSGAAQILGEAQVASAVPTLVGLAGDPAPEVRWNVAIALGRLGSRDGRTTLEHLAEDPDDTVAYYARWALRQIDAA